MSATGTIENAVRRASEPSQLRITDIRVATIRAQGIHPILRIDTNQGVHGLGEVRDGAHPDTALRLKPLLVGQNPCNVEYLFRRIKRYGGESREAGGVCAVEIALMDLVGKVYGVPCYQLLGGKFRDRIRIYGDTPTPDRSDPRGLRRGGPVPPRAGPRLHQVRPLRAAVRGGPRRHGRLGHALRIPAIPPVPHPRPRRRRPDQRARPGARPRHLPRRARGSRPRSIPLHRPFRRGLRHRRRGDPHRPCDRALQPRLDRGRPALDRHRRPQARRRRPPDPGRRRRRSLSFRRLPRSDRDPRLRRHPPRHAVLGRPDGDQEDRRPRRAPRHPDGPARLLLAGGVHGQPPPRRVARQPDGGRTPRPGRAVVDRHRLTSALRSPA